jgi:hypothetical protein
LDWRARGQKEQALLAELADGQQLPSIARRGPLPRAEASATQQLIVITDGPFPESKEVIGGYWFIVADSLEEATDIAQGNPCLEYGATVEVRPIISDTPELQIASLD